MVDACIEKQLNELDVEEAPFYWNSIYLHDGIFVNYECNIIENKRCLTGTYSYEKGGQLLVKYEEWRDTSIAVRADTDEDDLSGRRDYAIWEILNESTNEGNIYSREPANTLADENYIVLNGLYRCSRLEDFNKGWSPKMLGVNTGSYGPIYHKGNYLIAEEVGYTLDVKKAKESFVLVCDRTLFDFEGSETYTFQGNHTWVSDRLSGEWTLIDDHLLVVFPPDDSSYTDESVALFYLDFSEEEVYFPMYVKSDAAVESVQALEETDPFA